MFFLNSFLGLEFMLLVIYDFSFFFERCLGILVYFNNDDVVIIKLYFLYKVGGFIISFVGIILVETFVYIWL